MAQVKFKFDPTIYGSVVPTVSGGGTATTTDVTNADGTITRTISYTSNPTRLYFGNQSTESTALLEVYEYPYTSSMTNLGYLFDGCTNLTYVNEKSFEGVSGITNLSYCFRNCSSLRSLNLINWNLSSATSRSYIFYGCSSLTTLNLSGLNMGSRTIVSSVFTNCTSLQTVIMKNCTAANMNKIIQYIPARSSSTYGALIHDEGVTPSTSYATYWKRMTSINEVIKYKFAVGVDTLPATMTGYSNNYACIDNVNGDGTVTRTLAPFDGVTVPTAINFKSCTGLLSIEALEIPGLKSFANMFYGCTELTELDLTKFSAFTENNGKVTTLASMFYNCSKLTELDLSMLNITNVTTLANTFYGCSSLTSIDISGWTTSSVTTLANTFYGCSSLTSINVSGWNTSLVTAMNGMFRGCSSLTSINVSGWNTSLVTVMNGMFRDCSSLTTLDLSNFNTESVTTLANMFSGCSSLTSIDISGWDLTTTTTVTTPFNSCTSLDLIYMNNSKASSINTILTNIISKTQDDVGNLIVIGVDDLGSIDNTTASTKYWNVFSVAPIKYKFNSDNDTIPTLPTNTSFLYFDENDNGIVSRTVYANNIPASVNFIDQDGLIELEYLDISELNSMSSMFKNCTNLVKVNTDGWNVGNITNMSDMFNNCTNLIDLDTSEWNVGKVTDMSNSLIIVVI